MSEGHDARDRRAPETKSTRKGDKRDDDRTDDLADDLVEDPESPGATIDDPTPAEPNEPA